ncbi:Txe/YoeB family addiction module toxin [Flavobacterium sp. ANB]|uniref:Txe/YoeB family addiction module toxin n=1 Tax=unclassified Flavobacterium TaxID=196869 RepID=UPI0012B8E99C|nr:MULTISPECIES: Txe/YoeB family addiction module toxin [unclassified Flavobacterium]MBF4517504.1 Txe/YoeB family addiction module toxin [Flavobacterium sp. ANB]MTD72134.1 Txe/YoeB family addiction module toxin [Flavobacterium sp. LC2016-13]
MGKFRVEVTKVANQDIEKHKKSGNKTSIKNIAKILIDLSENPYEGFENPEPLKYEYSGLWSRRINQKDRLIYRVEDEIVTVFVVSAMGHYSDK